MTGPFERLDDDAVALRLSDEARTALTAITGEIAPRLTARDASAWRLFPATHRGDDERSAAYDDMVAGALMDGRLAALNLVGRAATADRMTLAELDTWTRALGVMRLVVAETTELLVAGWPRESVMAFLTRLQAEAVEVLDPEYREPPAQPYRICVVCLGNICRSPMAEAVLRARLVAAGLSDAVTVASAGTGAWHIGEPADPRAGAALGRRGIALDGHSARQIVRDDLVRYDLVLALDARNLADLTRLAATPEAWSRIHLLGDFAPPPNTGSDVPDPYYGDDADFDYSLDIIEAACDGLVRQLQGP